MCSSTIPRSGIGRPFDIPSTREDCVMKFHVPGRLARSVVVLTATAAASFCALADQPIKETPADIAAPRGVHWKDDPASLAMPGSVAAQRAAAEAALHSGSTSARTSGKTLTYYGGPVVNSIKVIQV